MNYKYNGLLSESQILIVDSRKDEAKEISDLLTSAGCINIDTAFTCEDALDIIKEKYFNLIIIEKKINRKTNGTDFFELINDTYDGGIIYLTDAFQELTDVRERFISPKSLLLKSCNGDCLINHVENALYHGRIRKENIGFKNSAIQTIQAIKTMVDIKDPYTSRHQVRVSNLAVAIAEKMSMPEDMIKCVKYAAQVHEFGKIFIPTEILNKPGRLSDVQFNLIKDHPVRGYEILSLIDFPWPIADVVLQHHEKIDGSGYPRKLKGDEIHIEAKIISVADEVSSMTIYKSYRPAKSIKFVLDEVNRNENKSTREKIYEPDVVKACNEIFSENTFSFDNN